MITFKQWKTLNESFVSTFGSVLTQPVVVGGVVGATGASDWSLEETKIKLRKYMSGDDDDSSDDDEGDDEGEAPKKKPKSFGGASDDQGDDDFDGDSDGDDAGDDGDQDDDGGNPFGGKPGLGKPGMGKPGLDGGKPGLGKPGLGGDDDMDDDMGGDDDMDGGDLDGDDDMGDMGDDMNGGGDLGGDDMGLGGDDMGNGMDDLGGHSAKGHVCDNCAHHEPDKNAKFCKMCGKCMSKFMKKFMSKDGDGGVTNPGGKKALPWLNKAADKGEIKKGGRQTAKDMFKTTKGGKKDPGKAAGGGGGKVVAKTVAGGKGVKLKKEHHICSTCGSLACEIHNGSTPTAERLSNAFLKSLTSQIGSRGGKWDDGFSEDTLIQATFDPNKVQQPGPGDVGYAPQGRIGFLGNV